MTGGASSGPRPIIGILGGGQLGRMLGLAGIPMGLRFRFLEPSASCPSADVGEVIIGRYDDPAALERFARGLHVATYEFENVPAASARSLSAKLRVFPPEGALTIAQDRIREKQLFTELGIATPKFLAVDDRASLDAAIAQIGYPCVLKTRRMGYDGKGQRVLRTREDTDRLTDIVPGLILEQFVAFTRELSIIAARSPRGEHAFYPLTHNLHSAGVLRESVAPAPSVSPAVQSLAESIANRVLDRTGYVGVLAIELFEMPDGSLVANEMAPRVHNSGHWTIDGASISQFELHLRAIMDWPLGEIRCMPSGMLNLLRGVPRAETVLALPGAHLHDYGKSSAVSVTAAPGDSLRKVGHVNITAPDESALHDRMRQARAALAEYL